jgi:(2R)-phospho-3-sulfolactate synthase (ComA)
MFEGKGQVKLAMSFHYLVEHRSLLPIILVAAEPAVYNWCIREFGVNIDLSVDHSRIMQLSCMRSGTWRMADKFEKIASYRPPDLDFSTTPRFSCKLAILIRVAIPTRGVAVGV